jgi:isopentenyl diphosphate isomerase/L-lactate dehydrogenase-like FMN-dependent dehydrogenase
VAGDGIGDRPPVYEARLKAVSAHKGKVITQKVKGRMKIFADGGIRCGQDVLNLPALSADAVLVGRPLIRGVHGGGKEGLALLMNKFKSELTVAMTLTGIPSVLNVSPKILAGGGE